MESEHMRYLGTLGLLGECSVYVPEDLREMVEQAFRDAVEAAPGLQWRRILNRVEIRAVISGPGPARPEKRLVPPSL